MVSFCSSRINLIGNLIRKYKERVNWMMLSESWALFGGNIAPKGANSSSPGCEQILGISMDCGAPKLSPINRIFSLSIYFSLCFSCVSYEKYWHSAQGRYTQHMQGYCYKPVVTRWLIGRLFFHHLFDLKLFPREVAFSYSGVALWTLFMFLPHCDVCFENIVQIGDI